MYHIYIYNPIYMYCIYCIMYLCVQTVLTQGYEYAGSRSFMISLPTKTLTIDGETRLGLAYL